MAVSKRGDVCVSAFNVHDYCPQACSVTFPSILGATKCCFLRKLRIDSLIYTAVLLIHCFLDVCFPQLHFLMNWTNKSFLYFLKHGIRESHLVLLGRKLVWWPREVRATPKSRKQTSRFIMVCNRAGLDLVLEGPEYSGRVPFYWVLLFKQC